jgi:hypothetical protein
MRLIYSRCVTAGNFDHAARKGNGKLFLASLALLNERSFSIMASCLSRSVRACGDENG